MHQMKEQSVTAQLHGEPDLYNFTPALTSGDDLQIVQLSCRSEHEITEELYQIVLWTEVEERSSIAQLAYSHAGVVATLRCT